MTWWQIGLLIGGGGVWTMLSLLMGAAIMKSSYSPPDSPKGLDHG